MKGNGAWLHRTGGGLSGTGAGLYKNGAEFYLLGYGTATGLYRIRQLAAWNWC
jgi:hypothetical protein